MQKTSWVWETFLNAPVLRVSANTHLKQKDTDRQVGTLKTAACAGSGGKPGRITKRMAWGKLRCHCGPAVPILPPVPSCWLYSPWHARRHLGRDMGCCIVEHRVSKTPLSMFKKRMSADSCYSSCNPLFGSAWTSVINNSQNWEWV